MPSIPASGPPERRGGGDDRSARPLSRPSVFLAPGTASFRHRLRTFAGAVSARSRTLVAGCPARSSRGAALTWEEKAVAALRLFEIDRSLRREANPLGRHLLRSGTAPFRHRFTSAPASFLAGAYAARSLHFAEPLLRRSLRSLLPRSFASADTGFVRAPARSSPEPSLCRSRLRLRM